MIKNKFEQSIYDQLTNAGVNPRYENDILTYYIEHKHKPDFPVVSQTLIIEAKGRFKASDRTKIKAILDQYPGIDYRIVFQNAYTKLNKNSTTTYADWCSAHCVTWSNKTIPDKWFDDIREELDRQNKRG